MRDFTAAMFSFGVVGFSACAPDEPPKVPPVAIPTNEDNDDVWNPRDTTQGNLEQQGSPDAKAPPPETVPIVIGEEIDTADRVILAVTWNLNRFNRDKADSAPPVQHLAEPKMQGAKTKKELAFKIFDANGVDLVAFQECYFRPGGDPMAPAPAGWTILPGPKVYDWMDEHCEIAFQPEDVICETKNPDPPPPKPADDRWRSQGRNIHWAECTAQAGSKPKFWFGCVHFAYEKRQLYRNIAELFTNLQKAPVIPPRGPVFAGVNKDKFILGLDANSHPVANDVPPGHRGRGAEVWDRGRALGITYEAVTVVAPNPPTPPPDIFTKIRRKEKDKDEFIFSTLNPVLDDLVWYLPQPGLPQPEGDKFILPVHQLWSSAPPATGFSVNFYALSDHLPVAKRFRVAAGP